MALRIGGIIALTTQDYPGKLACVVFVRGCPWRCSYCHNPHLQSRKSDENDSQWEDVAFFLSRRKGLLDAVVFSGGEPTVDNSLPTAIDEVKKMGFLVGLHTGGCYPRRLESLLGQVDWIGLDIKAIKETYDDLTQVKGSGSVAYQSLELILNAGIDFECRTTISPAWLPENQLEALIEHLHALGVKNFALQTYRPMVDGKPLLERPFMSPNYPSTALIEKCRHLFEHFTLR